MANRNTQGFPSPEEDPRFHDTYQFLRRYRDATYSTSLSSNTTMTSTNFWTTSMLPGLILPEATSNNGQKVLPEATRC